MAQTAEALQNKLPTEGIVVRVVMLVQFVAKHVERLAVPGRTTHMGWQGCSLEQDRPAGGTAARLCAHYIYLIHAHGDAPP